MLKLCTQTANGYEPVPGQPDFKRASEVDAWVRKNGTAETTYILLSVQKTYELEPVAAPSFRLKTKVLATRAPRKPKTAPAPAEG